MFGSFELKLITIDYTIRTNANLNLSNSKQQIDSADFLSILDEIEVEDLKTATLSKQNQNRKLLNLQLPSNNKESFTKFDIKVHLEGPDTDRLINKRETHGPKTKTELNENTKDHGADVQSVRTGKSDHSLRRLDTLFHIIQKKLKFYRFRFSYLLFVTYIIFLVLFATSIFISYSKGSNNVEQINSRIKLMVGFSERDQLILTMGRYVWLDHLFNEYLKPFIDQNNFELLLRLNIIDSLNSLPILAETNNNLRKIVSSLDDEVLKSRFFEKNVRLYYGDFDSILTTDKYYKTEVFKASDELLAIFNTYYNRLPATTPTLKEMRSRLYVNIFNDLQLRSIETQEILKDSVYRLLKQTDQDLSLLYTICFVSMGVYIFVAVYVILVYYLDTVRFFNLFANHYSEDLKHRIKNLERLKEIISSEVLRETDLSSLDDTVMVSSSKLFQKKTLTASLMYNIFVKRIFVYLVLLIPSIIVLFFSYTFTFDYPDVVKKQINSITKINYISSLTYLLYNEIGLNDILQGKFIVTNNEFDSIIDQQIEDLGNSVSVAQNFDEETNEILTENICKYYERSDLSPTCETILNGIGERGIRAFVYYFQDILLQERSFLKDQTPSFFLTISMFTRDYRAELFNFIADGLIKATSYFISAISNKLLTYLDEQLSKIITQFIASILIDFISLGSIVALVYGNLIEERKKFVNTINFVPIDFILTNNHIKMYMIKEHKESVKLFRYSDFLKKVMPMKKISAKHDKKIGFINS